MKIFFTIAVVLVLLLVGSIWLSRSMQSGDSDIIAMTGIHWHPELEIFVNEEKFEIPMNLGLAGVHKPIHTHEDLPIIHLEFDSVVREDDTRLGKFFEVWHKDFRELGANVVMTVNGVENNEFENYIMRDKDEIVLRYSN